MRFLIRAACAAALLLLLCMVGRQSAHTLQSGDGAPAGANRRIVLLVRELEPIQVAIKTVDSLLEGKVVKGAEIVIIV